MSVSNRLILFCLFALQFSLFLSASAQTLTAKEIIQKADEKVRGNFSEAELKMTIVRPDWKREMKMKSWSKGEDYSLILLTGPARDKGIGFLKRKKEMWNWQPGIDRVIKMPPSMMSQSWMGSDFTNDDLARASSTVNDYEQNLLGEEVIEGRQCWIIELIPKEGIGVVWGRIKTWVDQKDFIQLKSEFYDEDDYLVNTMVGKNITQFGSRMLPKILEVIPADEEGHKTIVEYVSLSFDRAIKDRFFSIQNMKRIR